MIATATQLHPTHLHDCDRCVFLGNTIDDHYGLCDLYVCDDGSRSSLVARYGPHGYLAMPSDLWDRSRPQRNSPAINEAGRRAYEQGMIEARWADGEYLIKAFGPNSAEKPFAVRAWRDHNTQMLFLMESNAREDGTRETLEVDDETFSKYDPKAI